MRNEELVDRLSHFLTKGMQKAIREFNLIEDGDRIGVALSGGKDSFGLLEVLRYRQRFAKEKYSLVALHVIGDSRGTDLPPYPQLEEWLKDRGLEYLIRPSFIAPDDAPPIPCERCTWNRRRTLFEMAEETGCNKVAFAHHLDDFAETALLNLIYHGRNETMAPISDYFGGKFKLIRPFTYVREKELVRFAAANDFPPPPPLCPIGCHTQRQKMKDIIHELEKESRKVRQNLVRSALRDMERRVKPPS